MKRLLNLAISDQYEDQERVVALQDLEYHLHQVCFLFVLLINILN